MCMCVCVGVLYVCVCVCVCPHLFVLLVYRTLPTVLLRDKPQVVNTCTSYKEGGGERSVS